MFPIPQWGMGDVVVVAHLVRASLVATGGGGQRGGSRRASTGSQRPPPEGQGTGMELSAFWEIGVGKQGGNPRPPRPHCRSSLRPWLSLCSQGLCFSADGSSHG